MSDIFYGIYEDDRKHNLIDKYKKNKITFINEREDFAEATKDNYLKLFKSYVYYLENIKKKDLYDFDKMEIVELLKSAPTTSTKTKASLFSAINGYEEWAIKRGFRLTSNPCDGINLKETLVVNKQAVIHNYYKLPDFWEIIKKLETKNDINNLIILILLRYGITMKLQPGLKWEDINREEKKLYLFDTDRVLLTILDIDDTFIEYIDKTYNFNNYSYKMATRPKLTGGRTEWQKEVNYQLGEYVLKTTNMQADDSNMVSDSVIYNRYNAVFNNNKMDDGEVIKRLSILDLYRSRKFDELYKIYNLKGELSVKDIKVVNDKINLNSKPSINTVLRKDFELISGIEIVIDRNGEKRKSKNKQ